MVNDNENMTDDEVEITNEDSDIEDIELEDVEGKSSAKLKQLREKLKQCEAGRMEVMEDLQRTKAEFLNARKRLEDEKIQDRVRTKLQHAEELLPLCDSFDMAMSNKEVWEKADESWRKGVEGIQKQLLKLLTNYHVTKIEALGQAFDPHRFEALDTQEVTDNKEVDVVQKVLQDGYEMQVGDKTKVVRPARVVTGILKEKK
jgi:molecular chaperone GrpE